MRRSSIVLVSGVQYRFSPFPYLVSIGVACPWCLGALSHEAQLTPSTLASACFAPLEQGHASIRRCAPSDTAK